MIEFFSNPLFSPFCILALGLICILTHERFRVIPLIVLAEFLAHTAALKAIGGGGWLFFSYAVINCLALYALKRQKAPILFLLLFFFNLVVNFMAGLAFLGRLAPVLYHMFISIYELFPLLVGIIMLTEIALTGLYANYVRQLVSKFGVDNAINRISRDSIFWRGIRRRSDK